MANGCSATSDTVYNIESSRESSIIVRASIGEGASWAVPGIVGDWDDEAP